MVEAPFPAEVRERVSAHVRRRATRPRADIIALVRGSQEKVLAAIDGVDDARADARPPGDGEWSLRDLMRHVVPAEEIVAGMIEAMSRGETPGGLSASDNGAQDDDASPFAALTERLRRANERMIAAIEGIPAEPDLTITPSHMWFGPFNVLEWAVFQHIHDEDHAQHAQKILAATA